MARRRRRPPPIPDPLLPLGPKTLRVRAQKNVLSQTRPQIRELSRVLGQEAAAGTRNITGVTNQLAQSLGGYEQKVGDIYGAARQQLAGINTEAANRLAASGQQGADALRSSLAAAGVPTQGADAIAATGRGAAAAGFATGAAELAQLVSGEAAGRTYAAAQPGIARLGGLQGVRELQARKQQELSKGVGAIQAQVPGLIRRRAAGHASGRVPEGGRAARLRTRRRETAGGGGVRPGCYRRARASGGARPAGDGTAEGSRPAGEGT